ncbi:MAG: yihX [Parcubacteria group bacterium]|nr:yihX [Parcubacteria group bacterium]
MLKAAIFDLNGIFLQSEKLSDRFERDYGVSVTEFLPKLSEIMDKVRQPDAGNSFTYWEPALKEWKVNLSESEFWDYWFKAEHVSEEMVAFARSLRARGIKVFILSNNFKERAEYYRHYPWIHDAVDTVYFSWQTGFVKPDTRAWSSILEENHLDAEDCIYFDDQEKNLKAAQSVGIEAHLFTTEEELKRIMQSKI